MPGVRVSKKIENELKARLLGAAHDGIEKELSQQCHLGRVEAYEVLPPNDSEIALRVKLRGERGHRYLVLRIRSSRWSTT